ncbi:MAG: hypothetical protein OXG56_05230 [Gammaproteobacteria bacterium]|nr:hypothetical protein [Gammaproteobacteria bacterium]
MKKIISAAFLVVVLGYLAGCAGGPATQTATDTEPEFGIVLDSPDGSPDDPRYSGVRLDVIVPVFDPGIPEDPDEFEKLGVWPELRRTEAIRFASALKHELAETRSFGDIHVTADNAAAGDLYVLGAIEKSNGEDIKIKIQVFDASGKRWLNQSYRHRVKEYHWKNVRNEGKDPYQPVFVNVAADIVELLRKRSAQELEKIRNIAEIRFANAFLDNAFSEHLKVKNKKISLVSLPAENDPMLVRTKAIRTLDGLFMDKMQANYDGFVQATNPSYFAWQEHSMSSAKAMRKAKKKATVQAIVGGLLLIGSAVAASETDSTAGNVAAIGAAAGGLVMLEKSFSAKEEGKYHKGVLDELGQTVDIDVAEQVVQVEDTTVILKGDIKEQYLQWRNLLREIYRLEETPDILL